MWLWRIRSSKALSTSTPSCRSGEQAGKVNGPLMVKPRMVTPSALLKYTSANGNVSAVGHWITACNGFNDSSLSPSWLWPMMRTCSLYVPGQTLIVSFGPEASTAAWIDVKLAFGQSRRSSSTKSAPGGGSDDTSTVRSLAPTNASPVPTTVSSDSAKVGSGAGSSNPDTASFAASTAMSGSLVHAKTFPSSSTSATAAAANSRDNRFCIVISPSSSLLISMTSAPVIGFSDPASNSPNQVER